MREFSTFAVKAVFINSKGQILLLQNVNGFWDLPGGLVEAGEEQVAALMREVHEELGVASVTVVKKLGTWSFSRPRDGKKVTVQNYQCLADLSHIHLSLEHKAYAWVAKDSVGDYNIKDKSFINSIE